MDDLIRGGAPGPPEADASGPVGQTGASGDKGRAESEYSDDGGAANPAAPPTETGNEVPEGPGAVPLAPGGYALKFAEGTEVDTALLTGFQQTAHDLGLTTGQAQKLADLYAARVAEQGRELEGRKQEALQSYIETQNAEIKKRPNFTAEFALARKTLHEFGGPELTEALNQTGLGSHPALFEFMAKVGQALGEPEMRGGPGGAAAAVPLQDRLWPGMKY
ncbi:peptidase [Deltaproteobacteria bacterium]|nr:peptidase [Deltaproteobacteria bacterium]